MVFSFFRRRPEPATRDLYDAIVAQARQSHFFECLGVPDTIDGRFDMISLHATLIFSRLRVEGYAGKERAQAVFDLFFRDMDHALRELGASDTSVPRKVKRMTELFYGAAQAYMIALEEDEEAVASGKPAGELALALQRNVYAGREDAAAQAQALAAYMKALSAHLGKEDGAGIIAGRVDWIDPAAFTPASQDMPGSQELNEGKKDHGGS
ncbi:ubiquinol-cytochrome C chaperone family protein [Breoghania sp.]|uniref:ubiquinol-cytochrome C chaperone family protein n=1 Tax=Breoghania sp. TaxID=2065378 RepID=UPI002AA66513|nr:ubiquinol-cytochrome C chaperone family protein [Breoghania sp.]